MLARSAHRVDLDTIISAALDRYEDAAERHGFALGLSHTESRFLADQLKQRLPTALKPLTSFWEKPDLS
jgi:hypothetical protein